ncbi:MAG: GxxExxY protein [Cytophagaceae bacterium]|nr:GxxExxY protein [Gemmatimonadaceae bacterium]
MDRLESQRRTGIIIAAAIQVHSTLGPGLLESAYLTCLAYEIRRRGLEVRTQVSLPIMYGELVLDQAYRIDLVVANEIFVEVKAVQAIVPVHHSQLLTYLRLGGKHVGLLINFHEARLRDGIKRIVNN